MSGDIGRFHVHTEKAALLVVDVQPDFLPGGALGVTGGDAILEPVRRLMTSGLFRCVVATQDWHPAGHVSFASSHEGRRPMDVIELYGREQVLWPDHCVQGSPGAALAAGMPWERADAVIRKGADPRVDSYSAFCNNFDWNGRRPSTGLAGYLDDRDVEDLFICGLARDFCVKWSAEDAADAGFHVRVLWDLSRPVDPASDDAVRADLEERSVQILTAFELP